VGVNFLTFLYSADNLFLARDIWPAAVRGTCFEGADRRALFS
jgi:hypothetical protein